MPRGPVTCTTPHAQQCQDVATEGLWLGLVVVLNPWREFVCGGGGGLMCACAIAEACYGGEGAGCIPWSMALLVFNRRRRFSGLGDLPPVQNWSTWYRTGLRCSAASKTLSNVVMTMRV